MINLPSPPRTGASKRDWAGYLARLGKITGAFKVFRCQPDAKEPMPGEMWKAWASDDATHIDARWAEQPDCNIGLAVQPGFVVLDADLYKEGHQAELDKFEAANGALPRTLEFCSASGGFHLIYATERGFGNGRGSLPGFGDIRGHGGYIVGPGSTFRGKPYTIENIMPPIELPNAVSRLLVTKSSPSAAPKTLPQFVSLDDPANIERFNAWLKHDAEIWADGSGKGNTTLANTGAMGSSFALSADTTIACMLEHWNPRLEPPWPDDTLDYHGRSGYRSAEHFGNMASRDPRLMFEVIDGFPAYLGSRVFYGMGDIAGTSPAREWAAGDDADGWVPLRKLTFLYGPDGAGKTALMGQWALAQSRGEKLFGLIPLRKMPVLFIACEDDREEMHRRFEKQGRRPTDQVVFASMEDHDTVLHPDFRRGDNLPDTPFYQLLDLQLGAMPAGDKLLILDNLAQIYQGDYYAPADISRFLRMYLRRLAKKHTATVIVLAHPSEAQKVSGGGTYGGIGWSAGIRSRLYFERRTVKGSKRTDKAHVVGNQRLLSRKKANYAAMHGEGEGIILDWRDWVYSLVAKPPAPEKPASAHGFTDQTGKAGRPRATGLDQVRVAVAAVLRENRAAAFTTAALSEKVAAHLASGIRPGTVRLEYLNDLIAEGFPGYDTVSNPSRWRFHTALGE